MTGKKVLNIKEITFILFQILYRITFYCYYFQKQSTKGSKRKWRYTQAHLFANSGKKGEKDDKKNKEKKRPFRSHIPERKPRKKINICI